ncbi:bcl-2 homologous antagonist/killer-like [Antedon mediterranea]|uniref:bcl-2 homologous antagonist/killer-like n=1 Tax=Antedon mediterranea TaxID=105859 RepID=UPI003AF8834A
MASPARGSTTTMVIENDEQTEQTEDVVQGFMSQRLYIDLQNEEENVTSATPSLFDFESPHPPSNSRILGQRLAEVAGEFDTQYNRTIQPIVHSLNIRPGTAFEAFERIAELLFKDGINWGRIVALLMFGYRIAIDFSRNAANMIKQVIKTVARFIITHRISKWIAEQGGWVSAMTDLTRNTGGRGFYIVSALAVLVIAALYISRR